MIINNIKKTIYYFKRNGIKDTFYAVCENLQKNKSGYIYKEPYDEDILAQKQWAELNSEKCISVVVPAYRTPKKYMEELIQSLVRQSYPCWELVIADASPDETVKEVVDSFSDKRIKYVKIPDNKGISDNTNWGLQYATGDYIGLLDHDDLLTDDCLYYFARAIKDNSNLRFLFSDEDKCDGEAKTFYDPNLKPGFNLDYLLSNNYICHFAVYEASLIKELKLRHEYDGAQDYDLILRTVGKILKDSDETTILHVNKVLYHWRCHENSTAINPASKMYAYDAGVRALQNFADESGWNVKAEHTKSLGFYRLAWKDNIFENRRDLAGVGGRILSGKKVIGGAMNAVGDVMYASKNVNFDGYMKRAIVTQNVDALDLRNYKCNPGMTEIFKELTGADYTEKNGKFDYSGYSDEWIKNNSLTLSNGLIKLGYRLLYIPWF